MANRVFEDRVGLMIVDPDRGVARLPAIAAFGGGLIRDVFLPRAADPSHLAAVRGAGLYAHLWIARDERTAAELVADTLADLTRLKPGAIELNLEMPADPPLGAFVAACYGGVRAKRPNLRIRINVAAWKAFALAGLPFASDPNLYACEQPYGGGMEPYSSADAYRDLLAHDVPAERATICYGAAGPVPGSPGRVCTLPDLSRWRRGTIFQDDLMADVGLI